MVGATTLSIPGIVLVVLGVFLVVVGFCGWLGALREIFVLLVIVSSSHCPSLPYMTFRLWQFFTIYAYTRCELAQASLPPSALIVE